MNHIVVSLGVTAGVWLTCGTAYWWFNRDTKQRNKRKPESPDGDGIEELSDTISNTLDAASDLGGSDAGGDD